MQTRSLAVVALLLAAGCATSPATHDDMSWGTFGREVSTTSAAAQRHFDRGLVMAFGYNHDEGVREFEQAIAADPDLAMAYWGVAYCLAPNINLPLTDPKVAQRGHDMAQRALALSAGATPVERALIEAMAERFASPPPADRSHLDVAYADAMREVWRRFPNDADVGTLFADAMLNLRPWDQWQRDGTPNPGTLELVGALEKVMAMSPRHIGANHLYIHAVEASQNPDRGLGAADRLRDLDITAVGHLVHMPSHIYIRTGRYAEAAEANRLAVEADRAYFRTAGPQGIYELYKAHNHHFQLYAAMFLGDGETALAAAREGAAEISEQAKSAMTAFADCYMPMEMHALIRFGRWQEILEVPQYEARFPLAVATWHYARGIAFANLDRFAQARAEAAELERTAALVPADHLVVATPPDLVLGVAKSMLQGEILFRSGEHEAGLAALRDAVAKEDALPYDEPRGWMQPVRHALGALLLQLGRAEEAERAYRADLANHRDNGWSLHGLAEALRLQGRVAEAAEVGEQFEAAWRHADTAIAASCYCRRDPAQVGGPASPICH